MNLHVAYMYTSKTGLQFMLVKCHSKRVYVSWQHCAALLNS